MEGQGLRGCKACRGQGGGGNTAALSLPKCNVVQWAKRKLCRDAVGPLLEFTTKQQ